MKIVSRLISFISLLSFLTGCSCEPVLNCPYGTAREPLSQNAFIELPLGSVEPDGWLREMLVRQAKGATGHLDELYPQVMGPRNGWLGGDGDQWERGPYWIDGLLPLAYILHDSTLVAKTTPWVEWALASQREDGQFGPSEDYPSERGIQRNNCEDWWPRMVVLKILQQYYSATSDRRVIDFMTKYFRYQLSTLDEKPLDHWTFWARYRGGDNLMCVYWLYNITGDEFLLDLGNKIYAQTEPYTEDFLERSRLSRIASIHCVNLAQGMKTPIVYSQYDNDPKYALALDCALDDIRKFHGMPTGVFAGDEAIHGTSPTQGTEFCTVVEMMFSLETMYRINGAPRYADLLEKIAYNALPAQADDDFMTRQYYQQANQISAARVQSNFDCDHGADLCFGLLTGYPCCTSNMHQGWPKFVQNTWYATPDGGLAAVQYAPCHVSALVADSVKVQVSEETKYPFETSARLEITSLERDADFPLTLRVPSWSVATEVSVNGTPVDAAPENGLIRIGRRWTEGDEVTVSFTPEVRLTVWHENSHAVERGPLVFALSIPSETTLVRNAANPDWQGPEYYEIRPAGPWNYALTATDPSGYVIDESGLDAEITYPWNEASAPLRMTAKAVRALRWHEYNGMAGPLPFSSGYSAEPSFSEQEETIELLPYGCTTLRITEFPMKGR